jgi:hypothetical protein
MFANRSPKALHLCDELIATEGLEIVVHTALPFAAALFDSSAACRPLAFGAARPDDRAAPCG